MPWKAKGRKVYRSDTEELMSTHATPAKARAKVRALYANSPEYGGKAKRKKARKK